MTKLCKDKAYSIDSLEGIAQSNDPISLNSEPPIQLNKLDWVIVGGESGPGARPMHPNWVRSLRDQCQAAGTKFFFKQWGDVQSCNWEGEFFGAPYPDGQCIDGYMWDLDSYDEETALLYKGGDELCPKCKGSGYVRAGKKQAGRILDGQTWDEMPEID